MTTIDCIDIKGLRPAHFRQLLYYINEAELEGFYYGNKNQFMNRHKDIKEWAKRIEKLVYSPDTKITK